MREVTKPNKKDKDAIRGVLIPNKAMVSKLASLLKIENEECILKLGRKLADQLLGRNAKERPIEIMEVKNTRIYLHGDIRRDRWIVNVGIGCGIVNDMETAYYMLLPTLFSPTEVEIGVQTAVSVVKLLNTDKNDPKYQKFVENAALLEALAFTLEKHDLVKRQNDEEVLDFAIQNWQKLIEKVVSNYASLAAFLKILTFSLYNTAKAEETIKTSIWTAAIYTAAHSIAFKDNECCAASGTLFELPFRIARKGLSEEIWGTMNSSILMIKAPYVPYNKNDDNSILWKDLYLNIGKRTDLDLTQILSEIEVSKELKQTTKKIEQCLAKIKESENEKTINEAYEKIRDALTKLDG